MVRYGVGPLPPSVSPELFLDARTRGECRLVGEGKEFDLTIPPGGTWADMTSAGGDFEPLEFLVVFLTGVATPAGLWRAPVPIVGVVLNGEGHWPWLRRVAACCDLVIGERGVIEALARAGVAHGRPAYMHTWLPVEPVPPVADERPLDLMYLPGTPARGDSRGGRWVERLARLSATHRVVIRFGADGAEASRLLLQSKLVLVGTPEATDPGRVVEAVSAGTVCIWAADEAEPACPLRPGADYVTCDERGLEATVERLLTSAGERQSIAGRARSRLPNLRFDAVWTQAMQTVVGCRNLMEEHLRTRSEALSRIDPTCVIWEGASTGSLRNLEDAVASDPADPELANAAGVFSPDPIEAAKWFRGALRAAPRHPLILLNLAEALSLVGNASEAVAAARAGAALIESEEGLLEAHLDTPHYPQRFDWFHAEWDRAARRNAGVPRAEREAKRAVLRARLQTLLGELTGDVTHYAAAALSRPDIAPLQAALGCALARIGRAVEAVSPLRAAVEADPLDEPAARAYYQSLEDVGDFPGRAAFVHRRNWLRRAASQLTPVPDWLPASVPNGRDLVSIVIPCCGEAGFTRLCLESVLRHTRAPYELILIDNGSRDETPQLFDEMRTRQGPERVDVRRNEANRGFAAAVNQGLRRAHGEFLVLLNNDTIVTPSWLEGLLDRSLREWPRVGMVGPTSNQVPAPQFVRPGYETLDDLDAFARGRRQEFQGKAIKVGRLSGFCLLLRLDVLAAIDGTLDERFGLGYFEDDDLGVRVRNAGFELVVALDVYVHHFGQRTFAALGLDTRRQLRENFERFRDKWGDVAVEGYSMPDEERGPAVASVASRPSVSLCMIVRDEEGNLPDCLGPLRGVVDEIIVVDTGSTDRTKATAEALGAKVVDFAWTDSFAAARNEALRHASGRWVFWMDADDRLDPENLAKLRSLFASLPDANVAYVMKCLCVASSEDASGTVVDHVRLFRNDPRHRWRYRVHEQILPAVRATSGDVCWADPVITHLGYADAALRGRKLERDLRLLRLELLERPDEPFCLFNLGSVYHELRQPAPALAALRRSLTHVPPDASIVRKIHALIVQCLEQAGEFAQALQACVVGRERYPQDAELLLLEADLRRRSGDFAGAEACFLRCLHGKEEEHFASVTVGLRSFHARNGLGLLYRSQDRLPEAEAQWKAALVASPRYLPAYVGLGDVYLTSRNWPALERNAQALAELGERGEEEAAVQIGVARLLRDQATEARAHFREAATRFPRSARIKRYLAQALSHGGHDRRAAELILEEILERDPADESARRIREELRRQGSETSA